jgi:uncharacterized protein YdcH (DUF465 family)
MKKALHCVRGKMTVIERLTEVINTMLNELIKKIQPPDLVLDEEFHALKSQLIQVKQELASSLVSEARIEKQLKKQPTSQALQEKLTKEAANIGLLKQRVTDLEAELQNNFIRLSLKAAQGPVHEPIRLSSPVAILLLSFLIAWVIAALYVVTKNLS